MAPEFECQACGRLDSAEAVNNFTVGRCLTHGQYRWGKLLSCCFSYLLKWQLLKELSFRMGFCDVTICFVFQPVFPKTGVFADGRSDLLFSNNGCDGKITRKRYHKETTAAPLPFSLPDIIHVDTTSEAMSPCRGGSPGWQRSHSSQRAFQFGHVQLV